ncbi:MAG: type II secretion system protein GspL [Candidatus Binataceae bacterium]|jgi:Tfp pilus assembly PilM family ATPase
MGQRVVALELAGEHVRAAVADRSWNSFEVKGVFEQERADDEADLTGALKRIITATGRPDIVISSLPGEFVAKRLLELPFGDRRRLQQVVPFALEEHLPFAVDDAAVAFSLIGRADDKTLVLAALARKGDLEGHLELLASAGVDPKVVTLGAFTLASVLARSRNGSATAHVMLDIDHGSTSMVLIDAAGMPRALRTVSQGLNLQNGFPLEEEAARAIFGAVRQTLLAHASEGQLPDLILAGPAAGLAQVRTQVHDGLAAMVHQVTEFDSSPLIQDRRKEPARFAACIAMLLGEAPNRPLELLNFRQGAFAYRGRSAAIERFRLPIILASVAIGFALIHFILGIAVGARELQLLNRQIAITTAPAIDGIEPALAKPALESKLKEMRKRLRLLGGDLGHGSPLDLLLALSQSVPPGIPMQVNDLEIDDTGIKIEGTADSYGAVDQVKKSLEQSPQFESVEVDHAGAGSGEGKIEFTLSAAARDIATGAN